MTIFQVFHMHPPPQTDRRTDRERDKNAVHIVHIATYSSIKFHAPNFDNF